MKTSDAQIIALRLERDRGFNTINARFVIHSCDLAPDGNPTVSVDIHCEYSTIIRILMFPLYVIFSTIGNPDLVDWCEDVAYFKSIVGLEEKKRKLSELRSTVPTIIAQELQKGITHE